MVHLAPESKLEVPVQESVQNRFTVCQRNDAQKTATQLGNRNPMPNSPVRLSLPPQGFRYRLFAPLTPNLRPLPQHLLFEVARRLQWTIIR
jgi:hypothetical protein